MGDAFAELVEVGVDVRRACTMVGRPRSTHYWRRRPKPAVPAQRAPQAAPANALSQPERDRVLALLRDPSFVDKSPTQVWAHLLDEGTYLCSQSTMYRILRWDGHRPWRAALGSRRPITRYGATAPAASGCAAVRAAPRCRTTSSRATARRALGFGRRPCCRPPYEEHLCGHVAGPLPSAPQHRGCAQP
jgi:hypothetical protein